MPITKEQIDERSPERHEFARDKTGTYKDACMLNVGAGMDYHTCMQPRDAEVHLSDDVVNDRRVPFESAPQPPPEAGHEGFEWLPEKECHGVKAVYRCRRCRGEVIQIPSSADVFSGHKCPAPQAPALAVDYERDPKTGEVFTVQVPAVAETCKWTLRRDLVWCGQFVTGFEVCTGETLYPMSLPSHAKFCMFCGRELSHEQ